MAAEFVQYSPPPPGIWGHHTKIPAINRYYADVSGGLVGYPRAYQNQFRGFNSHRAHILVGTFSRIKLISGKRESVS